MREGCEEKKIKEEAIMAKRTSPSTPTDEEILSYDSVPVDIAAKYIGWSSCNVCYALQQDRAPFGTAAVTGENLSTGGLKYTYNISPGLLIAYKRGTLEAWKLSGMSKVIRSEIEKGLPDAIGNALRQQLYVALQQETQPQMKYVCQMAVQ